MPEKILGPSVNHILAMFRIMAFADWQVLDPIVPLEVLRKVRVQPDLIVFAGGGTQRFWYRGVNLFSFLAEGTKQGKVVGVLGKDDEMPNLLDDEGVVNIAVQPRNYKNWNFIGMNRATQDNTPPEQMENELVEYLNRAVSKLPENVPVVVISPFIPWKTPQDDQSDKASSIDCSSLDESGLERFLTIRPKIQLIICGDPAIPSGEYRIGNQIRLVNVGNQGSRRTPNRIAMIQLTKKRVSIQWEELQHPYERLESLHGIGPTTALRLKKVGIHSVEDLADAPDIDAISAQMDISPKHLIQWQYKAKSRCTDKIFQVAPFHFQPKDVLYFDIETDSRSTHVWLIGVQLNGDFQQFYAETFDDEPTILKDFRRYLKTAQPKSLCSYSGMNFDQRILLTAYQRHKLRPPPLLRTQHVDLLRQLRQAYIVPCPTYSLKKFGASLGYPFQHDDLDGLQVALAYEDHLEIGTPLEPKYLQYNYDDVASLPFLVEYFLNPPKGRVVDLPRPPGLPSSKRTVKKTRPRQ